MHKYPKLSEWMDQVSVKPQARSYIGQLALVEHAVYDTRYRVLDM